MVVNWWEKKECGHDAKEGADKDSVYFSVPLKSVGLNLLLFGTHPVVTVIQASWRGKPLCRKLRNKIFLYGDHFETARHYKGEKLKTTK